MNPAGFLVWVTDFACRPRPQWWAELFYGTDDQWKPRIVKTYAVLEADFGRPLAELAHVYPFPPEEPRT